MRIKTIERPELLTYNQWTIYIREQIIKLEKQKL